jgi:hypothetical protein
MTVVRRIPKTMKTIKSEPLSSWNTRSDVTPGNTSTPSEAKTPSARKRLWKSLPVPFWIELGLGTVSAASLMLTLLWPKWIEAIFKVDPDHGEGSTELEITLSLAAATLTMVVLARREWRDVFSTNNA